MSKFLLNVILIIITLLNSSDLNLEQGQLSGKWLHYREKDEHNVKLFVKSGSADLPPARFRQYFYFKPDGSCEYNTIAPTDGKLTVDGSFELTDDKLIVKDGRDNDVFVYQIIERSSTELKLK